MTGVRDPQDRPDEARLTPYELVFGHPAFEEERFPGIREEAKARGAETAVPESFLLLGTVGELLRLLVPEEADSGTFERHGALLFQAYHFWRFGRRVYLLDEALARRLVERPPRVGAWELTPPFPAGYLQLPRHLFWARVQEDAPPEPVDGFFWTMPGETDPLHGPYRRLDALLVLGMRPGRPGFGTIAVGSELVHAPLGHWADADARPNAPDFENILPGGELQGWHGLVAEEEALRLVSLVFWQAAAHPDAVGAEEAPQAEQEPSPHALPPSALPYQRIRPVGEDG